MTELSTAALVLHDLGLAANFGGNLFGQLALNPAVESIDDPSERGRVVNRAWGGFRIANAVALATMASTWVIGRTLLSGGELGKDTRALTLVKDGLVAGAVASGIATMVVGNKLMQEGEDIPITSGTEPSIATPDSVVRLQRIVNVLGIVNTALVAGVIGVTAALAMRAGKSTRMSIISRFLP